MIVLGLTGSIGMGKTATAGLFRDEGVCVYDADAAVHHLYATGGAAGVKLAPAFPSAVRADGSVDRAVLSAEVRDAPERLADLERLVHPLVAAERAAFLTEAQRIGAPVAVLDIPLLFETGADRDVDAVVVVSADPALQRERVLARDGMDAAKFDLLLARQTPDADKRARARYVVDTGHGVEAARRAVRSILAEVLQPDWRAT